MTKSEERNVFLKYLAKIYIQNPNLSISSDTIYDELRKFNMEGSTQYRINNESLIGIQVKLNNQFMKNSFSNGYFWVIENRKGKSDNEFFDCLFSSIKIYVSVEPENLYRISENLFNFMLQENIMMQCKVAKEMRNDVLVLRVETKEDAIKVSNYINNLNYKSKIKPNPFLLDNGKVSMVMDGRLSYNRTLSELIETYLKFRKKLDELDKVSEKDFANFIKVHLNELKQNNTYLNAYRLSDKNKLKDFIMIGEIIERNINGDLNQEELFQYQNKDEIISEINDNILTTKDDRDKMLHVINKLSQYYSIEEVHARLINYINTRKLEYFTRRDNIRYIIEENFNPEKLKKVLLDLGWDALLFATSQTEKKYDIYQVYHAIKILLENNDNTGFTNKNDARSYLGLVIPQQLLIELLQNKAKEKRCELTPEAIVNIIMQEIKMKENENKRGRK